MVSAQASTPLLSEPVGKEPAKSPKKVKAEASLEKTLVMAKLFVCECFETRHPFEGLQACERNAVLHQLHTLHLACVYLRTRQTWATMCLLFSYTNMQSEPFLKRLQTYMQGPFDAPSTRAL